MTDDTTDHTTGESASTGGSAESGETPGAAPTNRRVAVIGTVLVVVLVAIVVAVASLAGDDPDPAEADGDAGAAGSEDPGDGDAVDGASDGDGDGADGEDAAAEGDEAADADGDDAAAERDEDGPDDADAGTADPSTLEGGLRDVAPDDLRIGTAVAGGGHHEEQTYPDPFPNDEPYRDLLAREFDSLTPENQLKWEFVHPQQGEYRLGPAEDIVAFAQEHDQQVRGHTLLWHSQNPDWLESGDFTAEELRTLLREHIETVVGHFRGDIAQWDVANEVFDDSGQLRTDENIWLRELGEDVIADAFRWAHEADPDAKLFLNDYGVEAVNAKSTAYLELAQELLDDGVPVHGFGVQGHLSIDFGFPNGVEDNLRRFDELGLETAVTELDVRMSVPEDGPTDEQLDRQAQDHGRMLDACLNVPGCRSFTLWGVTDRYSWVPHFFAGEGAATVWDADLAPRPAYTTLHERLAAGRP